MPLKDGFVFNLTTVAENREEMKMGLCLNDEKLGQRAVII